MWKIWDFIKERRKLFGGIILLAWAFSLFTAGQAPRVSPGPLAKILLALVSYPGRTITYTLEGLAGIGRNYFLLVGVEAENQKLKKNLLELEASRFQCRETQAENLRLKTLLQYSLANTYTVVPAQVIGRNQNSGYFSLTLNQGQRAGLRPGLPVATSQGLVGRISEVGFQESKVILLTDRNSAVPIVMERTRSQGIARGTGDGKLEIRYLSRLEDVGVGDLALTSGLEGIYPKGIRVGQIQDVRRKNFGLFQDIWADPSVDFSRLEEVLVIFMEEPK
jgi:rod shape-determining protein MreC